nr:uncharacterized protein LOC116151884 [Camelus dromedarius]
MALTPPFPGCGGGRDRGDGPGLAANPRPPPPAQSCYPRPPPPPPPPPPGHLRPDRSDFPQTPTDPGELPLQPAIMEESRTSHLPHIPKMFGDPYAACRLLLVGTQVSGLYCYNYFSRTGCFFAFHSWLPSPMKTQFFYHLIPVTSWNISRPQSQITCRLPIKSDPPTWS